jgi:hypothetical protein
MKNKPVVQVSITSTAIKSIVSSVLAKPAVRWSTAGALASIVAIVAGCASKPLPPHTPAPAPSAPPAAAPAAPAPVAGSLPAVRSMIEYRRRAAQLIMAANTGNTFAGAVPDPLYGIVVVTIAFNADGSIKSTNFLRRSSVGPEANNLAVEAARRVRSFGPIGNLPGPWEFNETFLYNDALKFQLRTIVEKL